MVELVKEYKNVAGAKPDYGDINFKDEQSNTHARAAGDI